MKLHPCLLRAQVGDIVCMKTPKYHECVIIKWERLSFGPELGTLDVPQILMDGEITDFHPKYDELIKIIKHK